MKKNIFKTALVGVITVSLSLYVPINADARTYNIGKAQDYMEKYALNENYKNYYTFRSDCTNFASQVVYAGGVSMKKHPEFKYNPMAADLQFDEDNNYWYSDWHNSTLVVLSYTWARVGNFRDYMKNNRKADVFTYSQTDADWEKLMQRAWIGDVVQCGNSHSILIEYVNSKDKNGIKYAAHSKNANNREFKYFKRWCENEHPNDTIYLISFK